MKVLLIRINHFGKVLGHPRDVFMPFDLSMLSAILKKEHLVDIKDNDVLKWEEKNMKRYLLARRWDLLVIKFGLEVGVEVAEMVREYKQKYKRSKVLLLDYENNAWYRNMLEKSKADAYIWGDPEKVIDNYLKTGKISQDNPELIDNLDDLPFYDHRSFLNQKYQIFSKTVKVYKKVKWGFLLTSRGCPFGCKFCSSNIRNSHGKKYREMGAKRIYSELRYMVEKLGINAISFEDDIFTFKRQRVVDLCNLIIDGKLKFSWVVSTRADCLDGELISLMKKAGCGGVAIGVESGSNKILKAMNKGEKVQEIKNKLLCLRKNGVAVTANVIVGYPGEDKNDLKKTIKLLMESRVVMVHAHYLTLYPDTVLYREFGKKAIKKGGYNHRIYGENNLSKIREEELKRAVIKIYKTYYLTWNYLMTYIKFRWQYWIFNPHVEISLFLRTQSYLLK